MTGRRRRRRTRIPSRISRELGMTSPEKNFSHGHTAPSHMNTATLRRKSMIG